MQMARAWMLLIRIVLLLQTKYSQQRLTAAEEMQSFVMYCSFCWPRCCFCSSSPSPGCAIVVTGYVQRAAPPARTHHGDLMRSPEVTFAKDQNKAKSANLTVGSGTKN